MAGQRWERLFRAVLDAHSAADTRNGWSQAVCQVCVTLLTLVDAAAVTLRTETRAEELHGASDEWAASLEQVQYVLGEGPGVAAFAGGGPVLVDDMTAQHARWPAFANAAQEAGAVAAFAFPLQNGAIRVGTLDLYGRQPGLLSSEDLGDAAALADLTASILREQFDAAERAGEEAPRPLMSYQDVSIATGMLAVRLQISLDDAFAQLRAYAYSENRSLLEVARAVIERRIALDQLAE
jgi:hypothetical protein